MAIHPTIIGEVAFFSVETLPSRAAYGKIHTMQISLIIPVLNEAESIERVLRSVPLGVAAEILVVDGGSTDGTSDIARSLGATVINAPRRGYGLACATGSAAAQGEILVFMDGDGADDPHYLQDLLAPLVNDSADLVLGSRLAGQAPAEATPGAAPRASPKNFPWINRRAMPWHQCLGNRFSAGLINFLYRQALTDLSPFRAIRRRSLLSLDMQEMSYGWPTEMIVKAARRRWRMIEIPVGYRPRLGGKSKISGTLRGSALATYFIIRTILRYARQDA